MSLFSKKSLNTVLDNSKNSNLKRTLGLWHLFLMGIGSIIGSGLFVITGITAAKYTGPSIMLAFLCAGLVCMFIAFVYTEVAAMIPSAGSVYDYSYVALGEFCAWIIGWMSLIYFMISATTVANGWSGYFISFISDFGIHIPVFLTLSPAEGGLINLPAFLISILMTMILIRGTEGSVVINNLLVLMKIIAIVIFIAFGLKSFDMGNIINNQINYDSNLFGATSFTPFGIGGFLSGIAMLFFGFNGFDNLATAAEEAKNPERDISRAIIFAIIGSIIVYMIVSAVLVAVVPYQELNVASPLALSLSKIGSASKIVMPVVSFLVFAGMSSVILIQVYAQSRVLLSMSRDGLLPKAFSKIHRKYSSPYIATMFVGATTALLAGLVPLGILGSLASMGALFTYMVVAIIALVLRKSYPDANRPFICPNIKVVASIAIILAVILIISLLEKVGLYFAGWMILGIITYFLKKFFHKNRAS